MAFLISVVAMRFGVQNRGNGYSYIDPSTTFGVTIQYCVELTLALGLKKTRLQIADRSVDRCHQQRMLGWVSTFVLWYACSGYQHHCS